MASFFPSLQKASPLSVQQQVDSAFPIRLAKQDPEMAQTFVKSMRLLSRNSPPAPGRHGPPSTSPCGLSMLR